MIRHRVVFYGLAALLLIAGLLTGSRVFYVLLFGQGSLLLCILILNLWAISTFTYTQELSQEKTLRGRPVTLSFSIHNEKPIPFPLMRIRLHVADERLHRDLSFNLAPYSYLSFEEEMACPYRGSYEVGMTLMDCLDLFGLIRLPFDMRLLPYYRMKQLLVYPRLVELKRLDMPALDSPHFTRHLNLTEDPDYPYSMVRTYRPGDAAKQIHWKVSMRQRKLMTRVYEKATEPDVLLILDLHPGGYEGESALQAQDIFCECATALCYFLLRQNRRILISACGQTERRLSGSGMKDFQAIYRFLAAVQFDGQQAFMKQVRQSLSEGGNLQARIILTTRIETDIARLLGPNRLNRTASYLLVAGPARDRPEEARLAGLFRQAGLPIWFIHYGDDLSIILQGET